MDQSAVTVKPLVDVLDQLATVLGGLKDDAYAVQPGPHHDGSIGGHVRHSLDHVDALLISLDSGTVSYDSRRRGTEIETNRGAALRAIDQLKSRLTALSALNAERSLQVPVALSAEPGAPETSLRSTLGRELVFVFSHTIHHSAMIGSMARLLGVAVPPWFGYAPSTVAHLKQNACAR